MRIAAAVTTALAVTIAVFYSSLAPAHANKMDGRCCQWSDGGRSFRYRFATMRTEYPHVLAPQAVSCINRSWNSMDAMRVCLGPRARAVPLSAQPTATSGI
jgi:hypothetical protein